MPDTAVVPSTDTSTHRGIGRFLRKYAIGVILAWLVLIGLLSTTVPQLEVVGEMRSVSMSPDDAPSMVAMKRVGQVFDEFKSDASAMIVLERDGLLGDPDHVFYDDMVARMKADTEHVEHVQDFWGDTITQAGAQSNDGQAAYVQVFLAGNMGEALANESAQAIQKLVADLPKPDGLRVYVTGSTALAADQQVAGTKSVRIIELTTFAVIISMLLWTYRAISSVLIMLSMVVMLLAAARGMVAFLGYHNLIGLSTFATQLLVTLAIAASTDYAIFLIGRYQEARSKGMDKESAYYDMFHGTAHVVLGSGMTIAGALFCLHFTNLPYFQTLGIPIAVGMAVAVLAALSLGPAIITVATRFGKLLEPRRAMRIREWRRIGTIVVRWPLPVLLTTLALSLVGLLTLPGYHTNYNDRNYLPADLPANEGFAAAERHFSPARMNPELLMIETDRDLRNPADFLVIEKVARAVFRVPGIGSVQAITRPDGKPIDFTTIPAMLSRSGVLQDLNRPYLDKSTDNMLEQAELMQGSIDTMNAMMTLMGQMMGTMSVMTTKMHTMVDDVTQLRDHLADFEDFIRPLRNYLHWEPHCFNIPVCSSIRSIFNALDKVDPMIDNISSMVVDMDRLNELMPQMLATLPAQIATMKSSKAMMLTMYQTQKGMADQGEAMQANQTAMGEAFNKANNDDSFYVPPEIFTNADFKRGMENFISPDGKSVRFIVSHDADPLTSEGIKNIDAIKHAAREAIKGTPWEGSKIFLGGTASVFKDLQEGNDYDLLIAGIAAISLIFIIMLLITRAIIASLVIVGTVLISLGSSFGLSILLWQHIIGIDLHFMVMAMAVIVLLAVGADYNLLLVARLKEELPAGINTGIIRAMGGSGSVVTSAGLVFAFTMMSMVVSSMTVVAQVGTTIGLGLLFDTLVIRAFMTPSIAALMGRWFWWPQLVRRRPLPSPWPKTPETAGAGAGPDG
ncbi:MAG TPA: MMPL family transporter [Mycobacterium sp.]|nr:MMPL family transporter [Mycobacterium sp.]